jgi:hypothetical protein
MAPTELNIIQRLKTEGLQVEYLMNSSPNLFTFLVFDVPQLKTSHEWNG